MTNLNSLQKCYGFNFNAEHNGIQCIQSLKPEDQGTEHQVWFTRQMLAESFDVGRDTIARHVESLMARGVVTDTQNCVSVMMPDSFGRECVKTVLYDLKVFNYLVMRLDTDKAWEKKEKFNDILVEKETGKEETKQNTLPAVSEEDHFFLKILHAQGTENTALALRDYKNYRDELQREVEQERDEAVRKRKAINDKRTATLMVAKREDNKKIKALTTENTELKEQNEELIKEKDKLFRSFGCTPEKHDWLTVSVMRDIWQRNFKKEPQWQDLKRIIKENDLVEPIKDVKEIVNNKEKFVNRYPRRAWEIYFDEELARKNQTQE